MLTSSAEVANVSACLIAAIELLRAISQSQSQKLLHFLGFHPLSENELRKLQDSIATLSPQALESAVERARNAVFLTNSNDDSNPEPSGFSPVFHLFLFQSMLVKHLNSSSLEVLCQMLSNVDSAETRFSLITSLQHFLAQILPDQLQASRSSCVEKQGAKRSRSRAGDTVDNLLKSFEEPNGNYVAKMQLRHPVEVLLNSPEEDILKIKEALPILEAQQVIQLVRFLQLDSLERLELQLMLSSKTPWLGLFAEDVLKSDGVSVSLALSGSLPVQSAPQLQLEVIQQPGEKCISRRNIRPHPCIAIKGDERSIVGPDEWLELVPILIKYEPGTGGSEKDVFTLMDDKLVGNTAIKVAAGQAVSFKSLKVSVTSRKEDDALMCIRFELVRAGPHGRRDVLASAHTVPFYVVSHTNQLNRNSNKRSKTVVSSNTADGVPVVMSVPRASITEIVPNQGTCLGGQRVCILGKNFVDTSAARAKFDNDQVDVTFRSAGTVLCTTPQHYPSVVPVHVSNDSINWSSESSVFEFFPSVAEPVMSRSAEEDKSRMNFPVCDFSSGSIFAFSSSGGLDGSGNERSAQSGFLRLESCSFDEIKAFLDNGGYNVINSPNASGMTLLQALLDRALDSLLVESKDLHSYHELVKMVALLLKYGANAQARYSTGETCFHRCCEYANIADRTSAGTLTEAAINFRKIFALLVKAGAQVNVKDNDGESCVHLAVRSGGVWVLKMLIIAGVDINVLNDDGETPLHLICSAHKGNEALAIDLFQELAKSSQFPSSAAELDKSQNLTSSLYLSSCSPFKFMGNQPLTIPSPFSSPSPSSIVFNTINVNAKDLMGMTALHDAASDGMMTLMQLLIERGSDCQSTDLYGRSAEQHLSSYLQSHYQAHNAKPSSGNSPAPSKNLTELSVYSEAFSGKACMVPEQIAETLKSTLVLMKESAAQRQHDGTARDGSGHSFGPTFSLFDSENQVPLPDISQLSLRRSVGAF